MSRGRRIIVNRLVDMWDPLSALEIKKMSLREISKIPPISEFQEMDSRDLRYHQGRVHHFVRCLAEGAALDPISIDNDCGDGYNILPFPVVYDGNHRLIAHILTERQTIQAHYGGRCDLLRYLQGYRKFAPEY